MDLVETHYDIIITLLCIIMTLLFSTLQKLRKERFHGQNPPNRNENRGPYGQKLTVKKYQHFIDMPPDDMKVLETKFGEIIPQLSRVLVQDGRILIPYDSTIHEPFLEKYCKKSMLLSNKPATLAKKTFQDIKALRINYGGTDYGFTSLPRDTIEKILESMRTVS